MRRGKGFAASPAQRSKVKDLECANCTTKTTIDPAHLIPRSLLGDGQDEAMAVIPLCRACHRAYDQGALDLLPAVQRFYPDELAFAVLRFGLLRTLRRVTNTRWTEVAA